MYWILFLIKIFTYKLICNVHQKVIAYIHSLSFSFLIHSGWVETWEIIETYFSCWKQNWDFVMFYLQLQKLLQIYTLTLVELQQSPEIEKSDLKEEVSCLKRTIYNGRRKVCVNFKTDLDKMKIVMYRYQNRLYLKNWNWSGVDRLPDALGGTSSSVGTYWRIFQAVNSTWWNKCSFLKETSWRRDVSHLMRFSDSTRKNLSFD